MSRFIKSARAPNDYPVDRRPQVALFGRSNVGKSSLVNALANDRTTAKTSSTPGHTKLVNFFAFDQFLLVDLPGYGYKAHFDAQLDQIILDYLNFSPKLAVAVQLCNPDVVTQEDQRMSRYLEHQKGVAHLVVLTKTDRLSKGQLLQNLPKIAQYLGVQQDQILPTSAKTRTGITSLHKVLLAKIQNWKQQKDHNGQKI